MNFKKYFLPFACGLAFGLSACGDDSSTGTEATADNPFVPATSSETVVPTSSADQQVVTPTAAVALASTANATYPDALYPAWKAFHYVDMETESGYYPTLGAEFNVVFTAAYQPAGRVIWSTAASTAYKNQCLDDAVTGIMKYRACSVSEGIGYGMLITYFAGDTDAFNRLWNYSRALRAYNNQSLTPWITVSFHYNEVDLSSATDADLDIATALLLMYAKTAEPSYLADALVIASAIWDKEVNKTNYMLYSGDTHMWTGQEPVTYNLSYFSPVALRLFALYDTEHQWNLVLESMYSYMTTMQSMGTGVFPDWSTADFQAVNPPNEAAGNAKTGYTYYTFNKESVRIPWRIAWDYYWFQEPRALSILQQLNQFISTKAAGDPSSIALATNYSWNLTYGADITKNTAVPTQWLAAWCATGIGTNADWLDRCTTLVNGSTVTNNGSSYFSDILLMLYSQLLNNRFVKPF